MRILSFIAVAVLLSALAATARAGMEEDCEQSRDPDLRIGGCTAVIRSGDYSQEILAKVYYNRGFAYYKLGEYRRAIEDYDQALRLDPGNASAYYNRGNTYLNLGEYRRAIEDYDQALRINPGNAKAYVGRGIAYSNLGEFRRAIQDYDQALRLDPGYANAYNGCAWALYLMGGRNAEALGDVDRSLSLDPGNANAIDTRAHVLAALGRRGEALGEFERGMDVGGADWVRKYQEALAGHGFYRGAIDGAYGPNTRAALVACLEAGCRLLE